MVSLNATRCRGALFNSVMPQRDGEGHLKDTFLSFVIVLRFPFNQRQEVRVLRGWNNLDFLMFGSLREDQRFERFKEMWK